MTEEQLFRNRINELASRAHSHGTWEYSDFLNISEQGILSTLRLPIKVTLDGGYPTAERRLAVFGDAEEFGYQSEVPIVCISAEPVAKKFADALTHRDFLGSILALGIKREVIGDIIIADNTGYIFCTDGISSFILSELKRFRRTDVRCKVAAPPVESTTPPNCEEVVTASERLDAIVSAVLKLSRSDGQELISGQRVFINSRLCENTSATLKNGDIISVRGSGRFIYEGIERETKKGKLRVKVRIYK